MYSSNQIYSKQGYKAYNCCSNSHTIDNMIEYSNLSEIQPYQLTTSTQGIDYMIGSIESSQNSYHKNQKEITNLLSDSIRIFYQKNIDEKNNLNYMRDSICSYNNNNNNNNMYQIYNKQPIYLSFESFLNQNRPQVQFIGSAKEIKDYVKEAFKKTTGEEFPDDIIINILNKEEFRAIHLNNSGIWNEGILGFAINGHKKNSQIHEIYALENELDKLMLVLGHEIGHIMSYPLDNILDEEAKAFAFSLSWMQTIYEENIANLRDNINLNFEPARNGVHDKAFLFVKNLINTGKDAFSVFKELSKRLITAKEY